MTGKGSTDRKGDKSLFTIYMLPFYLTSTILLTSVMGWTSYLQERCRVDVYSDFFNKLFRPEGY